MDKKNKYSFKFKNHEGYPDETAYKAIKNVEGEKDLPTLEEQKRFFELLNTLKHIIDISDFDLEEKIVLKDRQTGRVWH